MGGRLAWPALRRTALLTVAVVPVVVAPAVLPAPAKATAPAPTTRPACPAGTAQVASHSDLEIDAGRGLATVAFALADGCQDVEVSLASYRLTQTTPRPGGPAHEQLLYDAVTGRFSSGEVHELTAAVDPSCYHHVTFVLGPPTERFGPGTGEAERARTISSRVDGSPRPCAAGPGEAAPDAVRSATSAPTTTGVPATTTSIPTTTTVPGTTTVQGAAVAGAAAPGATVPGTTVPTTTVAGAQDPPTAAPPAAAAQAPPAPAERLPFTGPSLQTVLLTCGLTLLGVGALMLAGGSWRFAGRPSRPASGSARGSVSGSRARAGVQARARRSASRGR